MMPVHSVFAEPYAGSAAVARHKVPADQTILVDRSSTAPAMLDPCAAVIHGRSLATYGDNGRVDQIVGCAVKWLKTIVAQADDSWLIYFDPPYPLDSRSSSKRIYEFEMSDDDHVELLTIVKRLKCRVMISSYDNPIYKRHLRRWHIETRWAMTRRGKRLEHCWMNFDPQTVNMPASLDRAPDFRERERVKKKAKRWVRMLRDCPDYEREYIFEQLSVNAWDGSRE